MARPGIRGERFGDRILGYLAFLNESLP
uniref:Uncharacterized protein n=1 Tax=Arundo donax TaxID=35708 RepID=A0A0A9BNF7_ARUDO